MKNMGKCWVWMGNLALAYVSNIFEIENYDDSTWSINRGAAMELDCNYLLMCDTLLVWTYVVWFHQSSFAPDATKDTPLRI